MDIGLVSCTKQKKSVAAQPADLYSPSSLFSKASTYCDRHHDQWYILSAKHHLLTPEGPAIEPYDETLTDARIAQRREWAKTVFQQLEERALLRPGTVLVIHAGKAYYSELLPLLENTPVETEIPTEGLMIGETLAWYNDNL